MLLPHKYLLAYAALTARVWKIVIAKNRNVIHTIHFVDGIFGSI